MKTVQFALTNPATTPSVGSAVPFDSAEGVVGVATLIGTDGNGAPRYRVIFSTPFANGSYTVLGNGSEISEYPPFALARDPSYVDIELTGNWSGRQYSFAVIGS